MLSWLFAPSTYAIPDNLESFEMIVRLSASPLMSSEDVSPNPLTVELLNVMEKLPCVSPFRPEITPRIALLGAEMLELLITTLEFWFLLEAS